MASWNVLMYGFDENAVTKLTNDHDSIKIYIIEPRKTLIDHIRQSTYYNNHQSVVLIPKGLIGENIYKEIKLSSLLPIVDSSHNEKCFCTSLCELIMSYKLQHIDQIIFNIHPQNLQAVLDNATPFTNVVRQIEFTNDLNDNLECDFLKTFEKEGTKYVNKGSQKKILVMFSPQHSATIELKKFKSFVEQYNMFYMSNDGQFVTPEQINGFDFETQKCLMPKKQTIPMFHHILTERLKQYFESSFKNDVIVDYIVFFNNAYLRSHYSFNINTSLTETQIYLEEEFDIIYATKNCWYMVYQILCSKAFEEYIEEKSIGKKALVKILCKRWTWEYLKKLFVVVVK